MNQMTDPPFESEQVFRDELLRLAQHEDRRNRRGLILVTAASLVAASILVVMVFQTFQWSQRAERIRVEADKLRSTVAQLEAQADDLRRTQSDLLGFLQSVTAGESIHLVDPKLDWNSTKA